MSMPTPREMPEAYQPLRQGDLVKLGDHDAVVIDPAVAGSITVAVMVEPDELTWIGRYRATVTDAEAAEVLRLSEERDARVWELHHTVKPAQGTPVFGDDTREVPADPEYWHDGDFPVISSCVCGRQIIKMNPGSDWEYCGA